MKKITFIDCDRPAERGEERSYFIVIVVVIDCRSEFVGGATPDEVIPSNFILRFGGFIFDRC